MLDTKFERIVGDIGNPESFDFPILKKVVIGANTRRVVTEGDLSLLEPFLQAARELEHAGVSAITTSCGFLAMFQKELARAVKVPVFASSLLQVSAVSAMLPEGKIVGIMTADSSKLGQRHFDGVCISHVKKVVFGMENTFFHDVFVKDDAKLDRKKAEQDMVDVAKKMMATCPEIGAIVMECTNMPPYAEAVRLATGVPVFDIRSLANYVMK